MPFVLLALGILFIVVAVKGTQGDFYALLKSEFVGTNSFIPWIAAIVILGLAGYIKPIRPITHAFLVLVILVMILANGGKVFGQFNKAIANPVAPSGAPSGAPGMSGAAIAAETMAGAKLGGLAGMFPSSPVSDVRPAYGGTAPWTMSGHN